VAERQGRLTKNAMLKVAALFVAAALFAAIYVTLGGQRNGGDLACTAAKPVAASLEPLVGGELAAFQIATEPQKVSSLGFKDAKGGPMTLAAFEGRVALVNLWATWCAPCREEMPALDRLQAAAGGPDFTVAPISIDIGDRARPAEFLKSIGVKNLPLYTDTTTDIFEELKTRGLAVGLPVTILLDRNGCTLGHINGPAAWDSEDGRRLIDAAIGTSETGT
jgi:thiol-disulfide isomerase/thioredoxin